MIIGIDGTARLRREMAPRRIIQHTVVLILIVCLSVLYVHVCIHKHVRYWSKSEITYERHTDNGIHLRDESANSSFCKENMKRLPTCLIIGIGKCGTSSLLHFLEAHPQVARNRSHTEMNFFNLFYDFGLELYRNTMPYSCLGQTVIEKTPLYFTDDKVPARVLSMNPNISLWLIVRSPVRGAISRYHMAKRQFERGESSQVMKSQNNFPVFEDSWRDFIHKETYDTYLNNWLQCFKLGKHIHIVDGDAMAKYPVPELNKVENFLNLERYFTDESFVYNATKGFYCLSKTKCLPQSKGHSFYNISSAIIKEMNDYFRPSNQRFFNLIGKQFDWDYVESNS